MTHGFDMNSPLVCEGIVGDGCGGGRIFFVEDTKLFAFDPLTQQKMLLLEGLEGVERISKKACIITLVAEDGEIAFDLSALKKV
ncbi:MAG: thiamine biosynthesis protein ThiF [Sulfurimonas sp.]